MLTRPAADEYAPYYGNYISLVPEGDVRTHLRRQLHESIVMLSGVPEAKANQAYGPGKWTLKESLLHVCDAERVFTYRMLRIARGDLTPLPGFEQDEWIPNCGANPRPVANILLEFTAIRASTVQLVESIDDASWVRRGTASGKEISARALAYIVAGHELHHQRIFRERYGV